MGEAILGFIFLFGLWYWYFYKPDQERKAYEKAEKTRPMNHLDHILLVCWVSRRTNEGDCSEEAAEKMCAFVMKIHDDGLDDKLSPLTLDEAKQAVENIRCECVVADSLRRRAEAGAERRKILARHPKKRKKPSTKKSGPAAGPAGGIL